MNHLISLIDLAHWTAWKRDIVDVTELDRDALHIYAGVALQILVARLSRRKLGDWLPWLAVVVLAIGIEAADVRAEVWHSDILQAAASVHDFVNTMIMPTVLLILSRRWPDLTGRS